MKKAVAIGVVASFAVMAYASRANAQSWFQFEAGAGLVNYETVDGRWYQEGMPNNHVSKNNVALQAGFTGPLVTRGNWGVDWHAGYVNLGRAAAYGDCTPYDENYDPHNHKFTNKHAAPLAYFTGSGSTQGALFTLEPYYWFKGVRIGVEAGAYVNHWNWNEDVSNWALSYDMNPQNLHLSASKWGVAPVVGVSVGNGKLTASFRHYFLRLEAQGANVPPVWNDANVVSLTYKF